MKKKLNVVNLITCIAFFGILIAFPIITIFTPKENFSDIENRILQSMPKASAKTIYDRSYMNKLETYISDHFAGRTDWIKVKTAVETLAGKYERNGIYILDDRLVEKIKENGYRFFYHNHAFEFSRGANGERFLERILRDFPADLMGITFDTYWAQFAGADPAKVLLALAGRVECIHLKDMCATDRNGNRMAPVGYGNMDFERILVSAESAGSEYLLVEQDDCYGEDPFACLKKSFDYLKSLGLDF